MTLDQSQKNIEKLKNILCAFNEEWVVHFAFSNESEFEIKYFKKKSWADEMLFILDKFSEDQLPYGHVFMQDEHIHVVYSDSIYQFYSYDMTLNLVEDDYIVSARVAIYEIHRAIRTVPGFETFKITED